VKGRERETQRRKVKKKRKMKRKEDCRVINEEGHQYFR
jgi:hypothetical protein